METGDVSGGCFCNSELNGGQEMMVAQTRKILRYGK